MGFLQTATSELANANASFVTAFPSESNVAYSTAYVISGVVLSSTNSYSAGWVSIGGETYEFVASTGAYLNIVEETEAVTFEDSVSKNVLKKRTAKATATNQSLGLMSDVTKRRPAVAGVDVPNTFSQKNTFSSDVTMQTTLSVAGITTVASDFKLLSTDTTTSTGNFYLYNQGKETFSVIKSSSLPGGKLSRTRMYGEFMMYNNPDNAVNIFYVHNSKSDGIDINWPVNLNSSLSVTGNLNITGAVGLTGALVSNPSFEVKDGP
jgi:hypothetical protein